MLYSEDPQTGTTQMCIKEEETNWPIHTVEQHLATIIKGMREYTQQQE